MAFNTVNLAESVYTTVYVGFEMHPSGNFKPIIKIFTYKDFTLMFNKLLHTDHFYLVLQIYAYLYSLYKLYVLYATYKENESDIEFTKNYWHDTETQISLITYTI